MKHAASFLLGALVTAVAMLLTVVPQVRENWREQGRQEGATAAKVATYEVAVRHFADTAEGCATLEPLLAVKTHAVLVVQCGAGKALRTVE